MRLTDRFRASEDPLLKVGVAAMAFALACVGLLAVYVFLDGRPEAAEAEAAVKATSSDPLVRSDLGFEPLKEKNIPPPRLEQEPAPQPDPQPEPEPEPEPQPEAEPEAEPEPEPQPKPKPSPESRPQPEPKPGAKQPVSEPERRQVPLLVETADWPLPTDEQVEATRGARRYELPGGAALGLTVPSIDLYDVPVLRSNTQRALDNGVIHARGTSMPWSDTPERNVYLAGHRLGWPGTGSHLVFYRLNELGEGDKIVLKDRDGRRYSYRVSDSFVVRPDDVWVTGRIPGRDMLTLQTCTPIPGFEKRLIVRAERL